MMELKQVITVFGCTESYCGELHNCTIMINSVDPRLAIDNSTWYYVISKGGFAYNSNLDLIMFESRDECKNAAENKAKRLFEVNFLAKEDNVYCSSLRRC